MNFFFIQSKCEQYWPDHGSEIFGNIRVELKSELKLCNDCIRTFEIFSTVNGELRVVKHYQYLQWPDPGVPSCPGPVLAFVRRVHSFEPVSCCPTVVHCSAGVCRSACYIAIDAMLERIKYDNMIDIYGYPLRSHEGSDYINASYINGYYRPSQFIATQGPSEKTAADFWRMIMDVNCAIIVLVTNLDDKDGHEQCYPYWPNSKSMNHLLYVIDPINENRFASFIIREFKVSDIKNDVIRNIRQYHYLNWPIGRVPDSSESLIEFISHVQKASDKFSPLSPIVVHSRFS
ncbi:receptor-type tyrosine-protein phosphatase S-like [Hydra vulgaris]|uniref:Receptor-type tyrosine-protein phosphatase S-like n=1 Tax=Hydra vulgaris TaxID=6087 RepID=A0ABM4C9F3_HYDVU